MNVVCATGSWLDIPRIFLTATPDALAELYIREIREGIEGTGIRAGIIKVANDVEGVTEGGELVLRAVARTHQATGVPISTHAWASLRVGEAQVRIFEDEGVDLSRVYIGHSNDTTDMDYLEGLIDKGVWIGLDRFPAGNRPGTPDWRGRTETAKRLIDAGYADRIMLSHDWATTVTVVNEEIREERGAGQPGRLPLHRPQRSADADGAGRRLRDYRRDHGRQPTPLLRGIDTNDEGPRKTGAPRN